jgi:hypothetical protein
MKKRRRWKWECYGKKNDNVLTVARLQELHEHVMKELVIEPFTDDQQRAFFMLYPGYGLGGKNYDPRKKER